MWIYVVIFLLILFFIINVLSGFYLSKFIKHFVKALPLFIKDLFLMDRDIFRAYGFWCYCGLGRQWQNYKHG